MYNLHLNAEQIEFRDTIREFAAQEVRPAAIHPDRLQGYAPPLLGAQLAQASDMGLRALTLSETYGGAGADALTACIVMGELGAGDAGIATVLAQTATLAHVLFDAAMTDAQRARFLPAFMSDTGYHLAHARLAGETDTEWCYHRPAAAGAAAVTARVESSGDWIVRGVAERVANAPLAGLIAVDVEGAGGMRTLLVPRDTPGLSIHESAQSPVWYHGVRGTLEFRDCRVPVAHVLQGGVTFDDSSARLQHAAINLGVARAAYEAALAHAQLKVQGARRIIEHEGVGLMIADMLMRLESARAMLWQSAWAVDHPQAIGDRSLPDVPLTGLTCVHVAEAAHDVAQKAAEVFGAMGILRDMPLFSYVHEAQVFLHAGTGVTAAKLAIAEAVDGYRRPADSAAA